jgi:hypothetical protein
MFDINIDNTKIFIIYVKANNLGIIDIGGKKIKNVARPAGVEPTIPYRTRFWRPPLHANEQGDAFCAPDWT